MIGAWITSAILIACALVYLGTFGSGRRR